MPAMEIGDRIRRARLAAGMSQRDLAKAMGVTHGLVGQWESHRKAPGRDNVTKIAKATMTDPSSLLDEVYTLSTATVIVTNSDHIEVLRLFARLSRASQSSLKQVIRQMVEIEHSRRGGDRAEINDAPGEGGALVIK